MQEALRGCREELGDRHPDTLTSITTLAALFKDGSHAAKAKAAAQKLPTLKTASGVGYSKTNASNYLDLYLVCI